MTAYMRTPLGQWVREECDTYLILERTTRRNQTYLGGSRSHFLHHGRD